MPNGKTKYIFVTGGVLSSLGKGIASAALAAILKARGYKVRNKKLDPYLNVDPGTMAPSQHGECYVTDDGAETDLDLGHYERFTGTSTSKFDNVTTGQIYEDVLKRERRGDYLGKTVQVVPHITDAIKDFIRSDVINEDFIICEIGGTVGDIEGLPYLEAIRQLGYELGRNRSMFIHLTLLPYIKYAGELKTKPTQHSVKELQHAGIHPDMILCRSEISMTEVERAKIALFCNVKAEAVINAPDVNTIYEIPIVYDNQGMGSAVCHHFEIPNNVKTNLSVWEKIVDKIKNPKGEVTIGVVGKYLSVLDSYKSLNEALTHGGIANNVKVNIEWINAEDLEKGKDPKQVFKNIDGILVPGGFGNRGTEGKIIAVTYARENNIPYFGICFGMQMAVIEFCRNILGMKDANSTELSNQCTPVISLITEWEKGGKIEKRTTTSDMGGTMRLGAYPCIIKSGTKVSDIYKKEEISERHRHRYEVNIKYESDLEKAGMQIVGRSPDGVLPEIIELPKHPWFVGVQFHPELKSKPFDPHPLFVSFIEAAKKGKK